MELPVDQQLREVARTYFKLCQLGLAPTRAFAEIARTEFGADSKAIGRAYMGAKYFFRTVGIPLRSEETKSPTNAYPTRQALAAFDLWLNDHLELDRPVLKRRMPGNRARSTPYVERLAA